MDKLFNFSGGKMKKVILGAACFMMISGLLLLNYAKIQAASLTSVTDTMSRQKVSTLSNHVVKFTTPTGAGDTTDTITVTFPAGFTIGSVAFGDMTLTHGATTGLETTETLAAAASATDWGASFTGQVLTLTHPTNGANGDIAASDKVILTIGGTNKITNPGSAGSYTVTLGGTFGDTGSLAVAIATQDQVTATGNVDPYLACGVTDDTVSFGTLSFTSVKTDTAQMTAATNSKDGYSVTVDGPTLTNGSYVIDAIGGTPASSAPGTEQFGFCISASGGQGAAVYPYNQCGSTQYAFDVANVPDEVAKSTQKSKTTTFTMTYIANIDTDTEPGTYSAVHTYICTGNY